MDGEDGVIIIIATGEHGIKDTLLHFLLDGSNLRLQVSTQAGIVKPAKLQGVVQTALEGAPTLHLVAQFGGGFAHPLGGGRVVPKIGRSYLFVKFSKLGFLGGEVKDAP